MIAPRGAASRSAALLDRSGPEILSAAMRRSAEVAMCWPERRILTLACLTLLMCGTFACANSPTSPRGDALFLVRQCDQTFHLLIRDPRTIAEAESQLERPTKHVTGRLLAGDGGFNQPWSWHLDPDRVGFADASIELCDGCPSHIEENLNYWVNVVGQFCPWASKVVRRER